MAKKEIAKAKYHQYTTNLIHNKANNIIKVNILQAEKYYNTVYEFIANTSLPI